VQLGLEFEDAFPRAGLEADDAVFPALRIKPLDALHLLVGEGRYDDAAAPEGKIELAPQSVEHEGAGQFEPRLQGRD
jgi:hypothetical protein